MSHGCDLSDFETMLGPMTCKGASVAAPDLFLLENHGKMVWLSSTNAFEVASLPLGLRSFQRYCGPTTRCT